MFSLSEKLGIKHHRKTVARTLSARSTSNGGPCPHAKREKSRASS
jgi:hypothetical protein